MRIWLTEFTVNELAYGKVVHSRKVEVVAKGTVGDIRESEYYKVRALKRLLKQKGSEVRKKLDRYVVVNVELLKHVGDTV